VARKPGSTQAALDVRLERVEEMLTLGLSSERIAVALSKEFGVSRRQVRNWIAKVDERWDRETQADAPFRRERLLRKVGRFYTKALSEKKYAPAGQALALEAKLVGAFTQKNPELDRMIEALGPPPSDPTQMLLYAQRMMALAFRDAMTSAVLDERRLRWIVEFVKAFGMTHAKAVVQHRLAEVAGRVFGGVETPSDALVPITDAEWDAADADGADPSGTGGGDDAGDAPARHGAPPPEGKDR
jgi:hypothetical protein